MLSQDSHPWHTLSVLLPRPRAPQSNRTELSLCDFPNGTTKVNQGLRPAFATT